MKIYNLNISDYYKDIETHSDYIKDYGMKKYENILKKYTLYIKENNIERIRTDAEYMLEFLLIGLIWTEYIREALNIKYFFAKIAYFSDRQRNKIKKLKPLFNKIKGIALSNMIYKKKYYKPKISYQHFIKLYDYMIYSGEYKSESKRILNWKNYFLKLEKSEIEEILNKSIEFAFYFKKYSEENLSKYIKGLDEFYKNSVEDYKNREDTFFCNRKKSEYYYNMIGAEILSQALYDEFEKTEKKYILLPMCMREENKKCMATNENGYLECKSCNIDCNIGKIKKEVENSEIKICIIKHSSEFSEILKKWKNQNNIGLVGVACILNLMEGGYQMIEYNIPSQCVMLDYCGCKNHWYKNQEATNLNIEKLKKILNKN